jgi:hypothetical protein
MMAILTGVATALVVLAGLYFGISILINTASRPELDKGARLARNFTGALILIVQFLTALAILYFAPDTRTHPLFVGAGLLAVMAAVTLYVGYFQAANKGGKNSKSL